MSDLMIWPRHSVRRGGIPGHGPTCSLDPEIGCECGKADRGPSSCGECGRHYAESEGICECHESPFAP